MELDLFTLCDYAQDVRGKLTIVGTFDVITPQTLPAIHATCSIAVRMRFCKNEEGKHSFTLSILNNNGEEVIKPITGDLEVQVQPDMSWAGATIVVLLNQLRFSSYGAHSINLSLDNKQIKSLPFMVKGPSKKT